MYTIKDPCCDICEGRRQGMQRILDWTVQALADERAIDIQQYILRGAEHLLGQLDKLPATQESRIQARKDAECREYKRILEKYRHRVHGGRLV